MQYSTSYAITSFAARWPCSCNAQCNATLAAPRCYSYSLHTAAEYSEQSLAELLALVIPQALAARAHDASHREPAFRAAHIRVGDFALSEQQASHAGVQIAKRTLEPQ